MRGNAKDFHARPSDRSRCAASDERPSHLVALRASYEMRSTSFLGTRKPWTECFEPSLNYLQRAVPSATQW
jgi:hypothetical protein